MARFHSAITAEQSELIRGAKMFFLASCDPSGGEGPDGQGAVNVSPKGGSPLHVLAPDRVAYLDYRGSGDETARHARAGGAVTVMVMSLDERDAAIVRLYGRASVVPVEEFPERETLLASVAEHLRLEQRQVIEVRIDRTQTSCGYGVPVYRYVKDRERGERGRRFKA